ncbi:ral guanine nucleotide dissociation stimulator-like isoform 3-T4 [Thomomys bottae]
MGVSFKPGEVGAVPGHQFNTSVYFPPRNQWKHKATQARYKSLRPNCEEDEKVKDTLCSIFTIWMDFSPDDFYDRKNRDVLNELMFYVMLNMPSSDLLLRLHILLDQLEEPVTCQTKSKAGESLCRRLRAYLGLQNAVTPELMT